MYKDVIVNTVEFTVSGDVVARDVNILSKKELQCEKYCCKFPKLTFSKEVLVEDNVVTIVVPRCHITMLQHKQACQVVLTEDIKAFGKKLRITDGVTSCYLCEDIFPLIITHSIHKGSAFWLIRNDNINSMQVGHIGYV